MPFVSECGGQSSRNVWFETRDIKLARRVKPASAREQVELIKTNHVAFRPIDVKRGPDGAIYIAD